MGQNRNGLIVLIVFLGILIAVIGGALTGGLVGYYVVRSNPVAVQAPAPERVSAVAPAAAATTQAPSSTTLRVTEDSAVIDAVKKVEPAVVTVISTLSGSTFGGRNSRIAPQASGSGVAIDSKGYIVTNNHVIDGATKIEVLFQNNQKVTAKLVAADPVSDLAVIQVDKVPAVAELGDSNALQLGQTLIAIGSPLGNYRGSVTVGVLSGLNRKVDGATQENLIQTDAAINHGNSGGPLLNLAGQIIGINTLVVRDTNSGDVAEGLGFAIPSSTVKAVVNQLISTGSIQYPYIGIGYDDLTAQTASDQNLPVSEGVFITSVASGTPGDKAGLKTNDIVTAINGQKLDADHSLRSILFQFKPGDILTLSVLRGSQTLTLQVTVTSRPASTTP